MANNFIDFIARHSIYIEQIKNWHIADYLTYLRKLEGDLKSLLLDVTDTLDKLTGRRYKALLAKISDLTKSFFRQFGTRYQRQLKTLLEIDAAVQATIFRAFGVTSLKIDRDKLWDKVTTAPIASYAATFRQAFKAISSEGLQRVVTVVKRGKIDNAKSDEVVASIVGTEERNRKDGVISSIGNRAKTFIRDTVQHVAAVVTDAMTPAVSNCYMWVSVIDDVTTPICRERNGTVYIVGEGPLPPAHPNCRSRTVPWPCGVAGSSPRYPTWIKEQPKTFTDDILGKGGVSNVSPAGPYRTDEALNPANLPDKIKFIIAE